MTANRRWTEERIRADLGDFLDGRVIWPSRAEFEAAGRKTLRDAITRTGGAPRWAAEFGLPRPDAGLGSLYRRPVGPAGSDDGNDDRGSSDDLRL
ncbi:MAG TPA: hypothetical protein VHA76_06920 [Solirubrobacterales bacterium]|nr:hypothetical protein [Solirubrobacterales bacterium]